jgi:hypothetical protein
MDCGSGVGGSADLGEGDEVADALVIAFAVIVLDELADHCARMAFAEGNNVPQALVLDRANESFGVRLSFGLRGRAGITVTP